MISVVLVDDHPVVRSGYRRVLDGVHNIEVVGEAGSAAEALRRCLSDPPDVLVVDVNLPGAGGLELVARLQRRLPSVGCVVCSVHDEALFLQRAFAAGARAYVAKRCQPQSLIDAIAAAAAGRRFVAPEIRSQWQRAAVETDRVMTTLTAREFEVLRQLVNGRNNAQIGQALSLSAKTIANLGTRIRHKLGAQSAADLTRIALAAGL